MHILSVPYQATIVMQKEIYTLSDFYACWHLMLRKLNKICNAHNETTLAQTLLDKMAQREQQFFGNLAVTCAMALDPRFCSRLTAAQKDAAQDTLTQLWKRLNTDESHSATDADSSDIDITIENTTILMKYLQNPLPEQNISISNIHDTFIEAQHNIDDVTILGFWEANKEKFPELYKLAEVIFAISPTQAVVERSFSTLSYVFGPRRNNLSERTLENILIVSLNKDLFYSVNEDDKKAMLSSEDKDIACVR